MEINKNDVAKWQKENNPTPKSGVTQAPAARKEEPAKRTTETAAGDEKEEALAELYQCRTICPQCGQEEFLTCRSGNLEILARTAEDDILFALVGPNFENYWRVDPIASRGFELVLEEAINRSASKSLEMEIWGLCQRRPYESYSAKFGDDCIVFDRRCHLIEGDQWRTLKPYVAKNSG
jgi:hypothetical protein